MIYKRWDFLKTGAGLLYKGNISLVRENGNMIGVSWEDGAKIWFCPLHNIYLLGRYSSQGEEDFQEDER